MNKKIIYLLTVSLTILLLVPIINCNKKEVKIEKELLIYCGITMIKPMMEIKSIVEKEENCKIIITKGGSGNLFKALKVNKIGDLYLSGSESYIKKSKDEGLVTDTVFVGYNQAVIMVVKGNPKNISSDLDNLLRKDLKVVIGNPESGSIGKETKKILSNRGIFDEVIENTILLTTDSKKLSQVLKNGDADLVINWYAVSTWAEHKGFVSHIKIDEKYAKKKKLVIGLLKSSKYPNIAKKFMSYAAGKKGRMIFEKYGLGK